MIEPEKLSVEIVPVPLPYRGLNTALPLFWADKHYSPTVENIRIFRGEIIHRPGLRNPSSALDNIPLEGHSHIRSTREVWSVAHTKSTFYYLTGGTWTSANTYGGFPGFTGSDGDIPAITTALDDCCFSNGVDGVWRWSSPTVSNGNGAGQIDLLTSTYSARAMFAYANRLILLNTRETATNHSDRVRWCADGTLTQWDPSVDPSAGFADTVDLPGAITGGAVLSGRAYIFKRDGVVLMNETGTLSPTFAFSTLFTGIGCAAGRTLVAAQDALYFLGRDDIYRFDGSSRPTAIGTAVRSGLFDELDRSDDRTPFAFYDELYKEYWLLVPTTAGPFATIAYVYSTNESSWVRHVIDGTCYIPSFSSTVAPVIDSVTDVIDTVTTLIDSALVGSSIAIPLLGNDDKTLYELSPVSVSDVGGTVVARFDTADIPLSGERTDGHRRGTLHRIHLVFRNTNAVTVSVEASADGGASWMSFGIKTTAAINGIQTLQFTSRLTGEKARARILIENAFALQAVYFETTPRGLIR